MSEERRLRFHEVLRTTFQDFSGRIFFRPDTKVILRYPCVVYTINKPIVKRANNLLYTGWTSYKVTIISVTPGYHNCDKILELPHSRFVTSYQNSDLVHNVYEIDFK
jgi:hypothetical protein